MASSAAEATIAVKYEAKSGLHEIQSVRGGRKDVFHCPSLIQLVRFHLLL